MDTPEAFDCHPKHGDVEDKHHAEDSHGRYHLHCVVGDVASARRREVSHWKFKIRIKFNI